MLRDWQLSNPTGSLLKIVPTAHQGRSWPLRVYFIFFAREDASTPSLLPQLQSPTAAAKKILQSSGRLGRPPRETPVKSGDLFSSVGTDLPRTCVLSAWVVNAMGIRMQIIHNKSSRDLHGITSITFDF